jgi:hypothetical protein
MSNAAGGQERANSGAANGVKAKARATLAGVVGDFICT